MVGCLQSLIGDISQLENSYVVCRKVDSANATQPIDSDPICIASYPNGHISCTVLDAGLATSAAPLYFRPMRIQNSHYVDGGIGFNNPIKSLQGQQRDGLHISRFDSECYVSIGTGLPTQTQRGGVRNWWRRAILVVSAAQLAAEAVVDSEFEHNRFQLWIDARKADNPKPISYYRFNCDENLGSIELDKYKMMPLISDITGRYVRDPSTMRMVSECIYSL